MIDGIWREERGQGRVKAQEEGDGVRGGGLKRYIKRNLKTCPEFKKKTKKTLEQEVRRGWRIYMLQAGGGASIFQSYKKFKSQLKSVNTAYL